MLIVAAFLFYCKILSTAFGQETLGRQEADLHTLTFVHAVWRHGARTPTIKMARDNSTAWEELGLGEVTAKGLGQSFRLGQWVRKRYDGFLSAKYSPFEVYVRSSDYNRTLMSAQATIAAIYPPAKEELFQDGLNWRPIPIHTTARPVDKIIFDSTTCQSVVDEERRIFTDSEVKQIERENEDFLQFLSEKSGHAKSPLPLREMRNVFDPLICERTNGVEVPEWANETVLERVTALYDLSSTFLFSTDFLVKTKAGRLFTEIVHRLESNLNGTADRRQKFHAYSAHDTTIAALMAVFGVHLPIFPHFASLVLIEMHKLEGQNWVRLFYKNETDQEMLWEWPIGGCPSPCSLEKLKEARGHFLFGEDEEDCPSWTILTRERVYIGLIIALSLLTASMAFYLLLDIHRKKISSTRGAITEKGAIGRYWSEMEMTNRGGVF